MRTPITLFLLALVARLVVAAGFPDPAYPDSFYYVDVARQLAAGNGFNVDFVWIFPEVGGAIPANPILPIASNAHWMPLAALVQVPFIWLLGPTAMASALPFAIAGAFAAPLAWAIGRDAGAPSYVSVGAGVLVAFPALSFVYMAQPDNFSLYQPLVAGALFLAARGLRGNARAFALAGLLAGLATLSRNDGVLVLAVLGATFLWDRWRTVRGSGGEPSRPARIPLAAALGAVALFAVAVAPWYLRQLAVFGTLSPSTASGKVLFIRDIGEWNSITIPASLDHLLGMGWGPLLHDPRRRADRGAVHLQRAGRSAGADPVPAGGGVEAAARRGLRAVLRLCRRCCSRSARWSRRSTCPGGTFIHSAVALAPHGYVLALWGIVFAVGWLGRRRTRWDAGRAGRVFVSGAVGVRRGDRGLGVARPCTGAGTRSGSGAQAVAAGAGRGRGRGGGPRDVDRRLRDEVLDRPRGRRARQRPDRDRRGGRARLRHPVAGAGDGGRGAGRDGRSWSTGSARPGLATRSLDADGGLRLPGLHAPGDDRCRTTARTRPARGRSGRMTRREAWLTALGIFAVRARRARRGRLGRRLPQARGHAPTTWASPATSWRAGA